MAGSLMCTANKHMHVNAPGVQPQRQRVRDCGQQQDEADGCCDAPLPAGQHTQQGHAPHARSIEVELRGWRAEGAAG